MLTENLINVERDFQSLYVFDLKLNPSNRLQLSIKPYYSTRGSKSIDPKNFATSINIEASELYQNGYKSEALALMSAPRQFRGTRSGALRGSAPWHLCQTASALKCLLIHYLWAVVGVPDLPQRKRFTSTARLRILDAAGALEKSGYSHEDFYFFTGTLPGSTDLACQFFARNSRPFLDAFKAHLRKKHGIYLTFNCWEWQLREKFHLTPALHLHLIVVTKDESLGRELPEILKEKWFQLLDFYSEKFAVDLYSKHPKLWTPADKELGYGRWSRQQLDILAKRVNNPCETCKTIRCEKSPAAYLSKYIGKGCLSDDDEFQERFSANNLPLYYPSSWWSVSNEIRDLIDSKTTVVSFRNSLDECLRAYHLLDEIMADEDWQLSQLILPPFIPQWSSEHRVYRNFYIKSEHYDAMPDLMAIFNGIAASLSDGTVFGTPSKCFSSISSESYSSPVDSLREYFAAHKNHKKRDALYNSLPFYRRPIGECDFDWNDPIIVWNAKDIINRIAEYPEPRSLQDRIWELEKIEQRSEERFYQKWLEDHTMLTR
jgi:hypothetical protein